VYERDRPLNAKIVECIDAGFATLADPSERIHARLLTVRPPKVVEQLHPQLSRVSADAALVIVNQVPDDGANKTPYYDVRLISKNLRQRLGDNVTWMPIGPLARTSMKPYASFVRVSDWDWFNVIDVDAWHVERNAFVSSIPVIGRHSRPDKRKWPESIETLFEIYPNDGEIKVKVLGGEEILPKMLGGIPDSWTVYPFDAISPKEFLSQIDFYVYFHHSGLQEAFGRGILEALSSGAVVIVPPHFRKLFGDACVYVKPSEVRQTIQRYYNDFAMYKEQSMKGVQYGRDHFGQEVHINRLNQLIGPPSVSPPDRVRSVPHEPPDPPSNGGRAGRISRLKSIARRLSGES
jgi:hypothetical protein